jgi:two-component system nitrogen regulation sensor histidine kinase NtrY
VAGLSQVDAASLKAHAERRPFRDNTRLILFGIALLVAALAGLLALASRSSELAPDFLTEFVLYALSATNLMMLVALVFVLARNIIKLLVERRRALPFARFRARLVAALLGMTIIPALLVLLVGSELIRNSVDRWFNAPMEEVLSSANGIAGDYYQEQQRLVSSQAQRAARALAGADLAAPAAVRELIAPDVVQQRIHLVEVYRVAAAGGARRVLPVVSAAARSLPSDYNRESADRLAERTALAAAETRVIEQLPNRGELIRTASPIRSSPNGPVRGVVIASEYLTDQFAARARRMTEAYEAYQQLRVLKRPLAGVYQSFFLMLTLMILVSATWMGLYLAKGITRPIQTLATAADEIGAGHLDHRVEAQALDEFGALVDAFNRMADDVAAARRRLEQSRLDLERRHEDVEGRRRYVETILDRIATGVISIDPAGRIRTWNSAATRLLGIDERVAGLPATAVFGSAPLKPLSMLIDHAARGRDELKPHEVAVAADGRELHLAVMTTPLRRDDGGTDGLVVVFDDISALVRAQKVAAWREVARRLAHEIKNPLTPIQLCAERLRRHFGGAPEPTRALVDECTATIVGEVESLKGLVDEFAQFARMPAPRAVPTDLHLLLEEVLSLYSGLFADAVTIRPHFAPVLPRVAVDPEQIRRVVINVIDNAIEAMDRRGTIDLQTQHDPANALVRIIVADDGPGIPPAERDKLFLPYYSTKRRGSGLGLAIVRRIVVEHGGSIDVADNTPHGTRFTIELPA